MPRDNSLPKYRLHKASGLGVVRLSGQDHYLGKHNSKKSKAEYDRLIAKWIGNNRRPLLQSPSGATGGITIGELMVRYLKHADAYYRKDGEPTGEYNSIRYALRPLRKLYEQLPAASFGPLALKAVRQEMITNSWCRNEINKRIRHIVRMFKWCSSPALSDRGGREESK